MEPHIQQFWSRFWNIKERKTNMAIKQAVPPKDLTLKLILTLALDFMDNWKVVSGRNYSNLALENPQMQHKNWQLFRNSGNAAISQRQKKSSPRFVYKKY